MFNKLARIAFANVVSIKCNYDIPLLHHVSEKFASIIIYNLN